MAVDIVYLWVDGSEPSWRAKRERAYEMQTRAQLQSMPDFANVEGRFRDSNELRYNLRALERFFPDHGHIYIVTDSQKPSWLKPGKHLSLVDHADLIPAALRPTFDSRNIESYIHHITGLSERFFYLNDDVFFGSPVVLDNWFFDGGAYVSFADELGACQTDFESTARELSLEWLHSNHLKAHSAQAFAHAPRPMLRSLCCAFEKAAPEVFKQVRSTVFRTSNSPSIVSDLLMRWSLAKGSSKVRSYAHLYVSNGDVDQSEQLDSLERGLGSFDFFCINDTTDDAPAHDARLLKQQQTLGRIFPMASSFE